MKASRFLLLLFTGAAMAFSIPCQPAVSLPVHLAHASHDESYYRRIYHDAWQLVKDNYYPRDKLTDWDRLKDEYDGRLQTRDQLVEALKDMIGSLGDEYTYVLSADDLSERRVERDSKRVVQASVLPGNVGYIDISTFSSRSVVSEFRRAMKNVGDVDGYLIDLRNNHGGYVRLAHDVFAMLADSGTFMRFEGRANGQRDDERFALTSGGWTVAHNGKLCRKNRLPNLSHGKPIVVLVNEDTRSAAELLAGALRDNGRAMLVGTRTFGKGVLQNAYALGDGIEIKVVTARYFLPDGGNIHKRGLLPDIVFDETNTSSHGDGQLKQAETVLQQALVQYHLAQQRSVAVSGGAQTRL